MKQIYVHALLLLFVFHSACVQNPNNAPHNSAKSGREGYSESYLKEAATSKVPMSMVRSVKQASNGDILIASYLGVFRYDARQANGQEPSFTNITSAISSPSFWDVLEDRKGNLWFATKDSGVYYYPAHLSDGAGHTGFQHFTTKQGLVNDRVIKIYEDKAGNIWFATGGGASRYDGKSFRNFTTKEGLCNEDLTTIMEDRTGKLWFGTRGNACTYDGKAFTVLVHHGKAFQNVWSIIEDKKGNIWLGDCGYDPSCHGLWRYDGSTFTKVSQLGAYAIIQDSKGNIWTTGELNKKPWALSRYDAKSLYNQVPAVTEIMSGGPFSGILEAKDGSIWVGAFGPRSWVYRYDASQPDGQGKNITEFRREVDW